MCNNNTKFMGQIKSCIPSSCSFCLKFRKTLHKLEHNCITRDKETWRFKINYYELRAKDHNNLLICEDCIINYAKMGKLLNDSIEDSYMGKLIIASKKNSFITKLTIPIAEHCYFCDNTFDDVKAIDDRISIFPSYLIGNIYTGKYFKFPKDKGRLTFGEDWSCAKCFEKIKTIELRSEKPFTLNCFACGIKPLIGDLYYSIRIYNIDHNDIIGLVFATYFQEKNAKLEEFYGKDKLEELTARLKLNTNIWHPQYTMLCNCCANIYTNMSLLDVKYIENSPMIDYVIRVG